ncbi:MAG TPA: protein kinase [Ktedonobacterales bacterium]
MQERRLGSYELIRRLGEGGMAQVYLARDARLGREVAVKVLDSHLAERPGFRERFLREAQLAAALDHPNIVPLYDYGEIGALYLVMPYLSGGSLQEVLKRGPLPVGEVAKYGAQIADALEYAHKRNVVHRDVKPANMLLHADGRVLLADFGLAKILDRNERPATSRGRPDAGTPEYMAPEQIEGRTEARSDIYGLGVVLYLLLTGQLPFTGATSAAVMEGHLYRLPEPPRRRNPKVTPAMEAVVLRALAKHPADRYQTGGELGAALMSALVAGDAEPLPFASGPSVPPFSPPLGLSDIPPRSIGPISVAPFAAGPSAYPAGPEEPPAELGGYATGPSAPYLGPGASGLTGRPAGSRMTARVLPQLDLPGMSQRSPYPSQTSSVGRRSFSSSMHGSAGPARPAGMMPSPPPALPPAQMTPPAFTMPPVSMAQVPAMTVAPGAPGGDPLVGSMAVEPHGHSLRFKLVLAVLILLLLALIGVFVFWAQASQILVH